MGVESDKPLWVREHSCPARGFGMDRDANAAINILSRGFEKGGIIQRYNARGDCVRSVSFLWSEVVDENRVRERPSHG